MILYKIFEKQGREENLHIQKRVEAVLSSADSFSNYQGPEWETRNW